MLDQPAVSGWIARCLEHLLAIPNVELALVIVNAAPPRKSPLQKLASGLKQETGRFSLPTLYFGLSLPYLNKHQEPVQDLLQSIPTITCKVRKRGRFSEY